MVLDNFILEKYDSNNAEHNMVVSTLSGEKSKESKSYLGNLFYAVQCIEKRRENHPVNGAYIVYYNDEIVGYISITSLVSKENDQNISHQISYGIKKQYRGGYLGALLLQEFSEKIFDLFPQVCQLTAIVDAENEASKKLLDLVGYISKDDKEYIQMRPEYNHISEKKR